MKQNKKNHKISSINKINLQREILNIGYKLPYL